MEETHQEYTVQIYSTDLANDAIATARAGLYPPNIIQDITLERLRRFFVKHDGMYRIKKEIRDMIVFASHDVIKDPPFTNLDLISCRNLLIYLEPELQNRLIPVFHYALKPGGVLFLSPSEGIGNHTELFTSLSRKWKFYRTTTPTHSFTAPRAAMVHGLSWSAVSGGKKIEEVMKKSKETNFAGFVRQALVQCFALASVVTDLKGNILYVHGETGKYLRPAPGQASLNVIDMARKGLKLEVQAAIRAMASAGAPTLNKEIQVKINGGFSAVSLSIRLLPGPDGNQNLLLISFQDIATPITKPRRKRIAKPIELERIEELERDFSQLEENYRISVEEQQVSNEELKSTNEELQSANEELQSTNEELETSKEELQSINEELISVNSELQGKIEQLAVMQNDMKNLLDNINIGIIFLDQRLIIRSFTREAVRIYRLIASDIGRPLIDIKPVVEGSDLIIAAQAVMDSLIPYESEIMINNTWMLACIQPYRTLENIINGVVMTFTDITSRIQAEADLRVAATAFESQEGIFITDANKVILKVNRAFTQITGYSAEEVIGQASNLLSLEHSNTAPADAIWESIKNTGAWHGEFWNRHKNGEIRPEWRTITAVQRSDGTVLHYVVTLIDITQQKITSAQIEQLAFYDPLTNLPNRRLLKDRLHLALASSTRNKQYGALLFIDLDNFKTLNDTLGHSLGDLLLQQVAQRLMSNIRENDTAARPGGG